MLLSKLREIVAVATQGRAHNLFAQYVTSYDLLCTQNGTDWTVIDTFAGNEDRNTIVEHELEEKVKCRAVRFNPKTWSGYPSMRVEVYYKDSRYQDVVV